MQLSFCRTSDIVAFLEAPLMTQRLLFPRFFAPTALLLAGGGLLAVACSSDEDSPPATGDNALQPGPGPAQGAGGATTMPPDPTAAGGTAPVASGGSEGLPNNIPVTPVDEQPNPVAENPQPETPPGAGLAPNCNPPEGDVPTLTLELVANNLTQPLLVRSAPGDDSRLFVVEQGGAVRVLVDGTLQEDPFIDLGDLVTAGGERGLLGLAFHPDYVNNGLFYLHFSSAELNGSGQIAEFSVDPDNRSLANAASRRNVIAFPNDPQPNHNGGEITFGTDGFLYIGMGDGGGGDDQHGATGNGQNLNTLLGKLLRIDVNGRDVGDAYSIPPNNLAAQTGQQALPEIWAYGLRNPWRFSFDACTQDLYIGDVGQNAIEEVDFLAAPVQAGTNFGWRIMEGPDCRPGDTVCPQADRSALALPVDSYSHAVGNSVTGGFVYRGSNVPGLRGRYIYADYQTEVFFSFNMAGGQMTNRQDITNQMRPAGGGTFGGIASFGQDNAGEIYVTAYQPGAIYRVAAAP
jgi:glucose/arabinose dehydrogenase